jgi:hypothetical protein
MTSAASRGWPSANAYSQALQNPDTAFREPILRSATTARDRLGMPLVMSGNFAYVFKLDLQGGGARAVKCFRRALGDREPRFLAIDECLDKAALPEAARFEYEREGVLVEGKWRPALVMEWVQGPTLDVYVGELLRGGQTAALRGLAEQWAQLVAKLADAGVAHGDLQHGNVIVTAGGLRLVDLDGMFVPALRGRGAPDEVGHRHYQHPARRVTDFDERLDRFSSLVIHVSLLALAEDPTLWRDFHDDGLILDPGDFADPGASRAFARLLARPGEVGRLAATLVKACRGPLAEVPALTDLVTVKRSRLPIWLRQPIVPTVETKTREAAAGEVVAAGPRPSPPPPPATKPAFVLQPAITRPPPPTVVPSRRRIRSGGPTVATGWPPYESPFRPVALLGAAGAVLGLACSGCWWPMLVEYFRRAGVPDGWRPFAAGATYVVLCTGATLAVALSLGWDVRLALVKLRARLGLRLKSDAAFVASPILGVYHRPDCVHAATIGARNRVWITHAYEAQAGGFRPCSVCAPRFP